MRAFTIYTVHSDGAAGNTFIMSSSQQQQLKSNLMLVGQQSSWRSNRVHKNGRGLLLSSGASAFSSMPIAVALFLPHFAHLILECTELKNAGEDLEMLNLSHNTYIMYKYMYIQFTAIPVVRARLSTYTSISSPQFA